VKLVCKLLTAVSQGDDWASKGEAIIADNASTPIDRNREGRQHAAWSRMSHDPARFLFTSFINFSYSKAFDCERGRVHRPAQIRLHSKPDRKLNLDLSEICPLDNYEAVFGRNPTVEP
jgi:hypothetical protein